MASTACCCSCSTNVDRFAPIITFVAVMNVLFGLMLIVVDVKAGLPALWVRSKVRPSSSSALPSPC